MNIGHCGVRGESGGPAVPSVLLQNVNKNRGSVEFLRRAAFDLSKKFGAGVADYIIPRYRPGRACSARELSGAMRSDTDDNVALN
jgi:hypothetical protein